jgi:hypothetical protein
MHGEKIPSVTSRFDDRWTVRVVVTLDDDYTTHIALLEIEPLHTAQVEEINSRSEYRWV